jgi:tRNA pseudouridine13 synthase
MIYKHLSKDFEVNELYDLESITQEDEGHGRIYYYFILEKTNYTQIKALEKVANIFKVRRDDIHFAGTKDRVGVTRQLISVKGVKKHTFENNVAFFNKRLGPDLKLTFIDRFNSRISLGDNLGNSFVITLRDLNQGEDLCIRKGVLEVAREGVLNYFDDQRFGYAGNSHIIGKYVLKNDLESAVKEILFSLPPTPREEFSLWVSKIKENWKEIKDQNQGVISSIIKSAPKFYQNECRMLRHLHDHKNDFPGAFRVIHKKLRTLYVNAYQSYLFNEVLTLSVDELETCVNSVSGTLPGGIELMHSGIDTSSSYGKIYKELFEKDGLSLEDFSLSSMPELKQEFVTRKTRVFVQDLKIHCIAKDDCFENKNKLIISFSLGSGSYATNVIKELMR